MIVVDVDINTLQSIDRKHFYTVSDTKLDIYSTMNGMLYRYTHTRVSPEDDALFSEKYLTDSVRVKQLSNLNEYQYQQMFLHMSQQLEDIITKLSRIEEVSK